MFALHSPISFGSFPSYRHGVKGGFDYTVNDTNDPSEDDSPNEGSEHEDEGIDYKEAVPKKPYLQSLQ